MVGSLVIILPEVYGKFSANERILKNRLRFDVVTSVSFVACFFEHSVDIRHVVLSLPILDRL